MADRFGIYCGSFTHAGGTLDLRQLDEQEFNPGTRKKTIRPGGSLSPAAHILSTANPRCRFSTCDCYSVLSAMGGNLHLFCTGGHVMRYQKRLEGGAFATGSDHFMQSTAKGFLHVTSIDVDIDSDEGATMNLEYVPLSILGENPITNSPLQSLGAAPAPAFMSQFFMGGLWLGASPYLGLTRIGIQPGITFGSRRSDGGVFPRSGNSSITAYDPMISLSFMNAAVAYDIGTSFLSVLGSAVKTYFQRGTTAADGRVSGLSTSHVKIAAAAGSWGDNNLRVSGEGDTESTVTVMPTGALSVALDLALGA